MSDERRRRLERARAAGDESASIALLADRIRSEAEGLTKLCDRCDYGCAFYLDETHKSGECWDAGGCCPNCTSGRVPWAWGGGDGRLHLAAFCGHEPAIQVAGWKDEECGCYLRCGTLHEHVVRSARGNTFGWVSELADWGIEFLILAASCASLLVSEASQHAAREKLDEEVEGLREIRAELRGQPFEDREAERLRWLARRAVIQCAFDWLEDQEPGEFLSWGIAMDYWVSIQDRAFSEGEDAPLSEGPVPFPPVPGADLEGESSAAIHSAIRILGDEQRVLTEIKTRLVGYALRES